MHSTEGNEIVILVDANDKILCKILREILNNVEPNFGNFSNFVRAFVFKSSKNKDF